VLGQPTGQQPGGFNVGVADLDHVDLMLRLSRDEEQALLTRRTRLKEAGSEVTDVVNEAQLAKTVPAGPVC
jgi:hypothetical protein